jgi:hypothetical protein
MKKEIQVITETALCPTTDQMNGHSIDTDPFPRLKEFLEDGFEIKHIKTTIFDGRFDGVDGEENIEAQINCFAILEKSIED